jgi:hypothetical protein
VKDSVSRDPNEYSHKLTELLTIPLCDEDMANLAQNCQDLGSNPKPAVVGRALHRLAEDIVNQGLVTIQSIYAVYNAKAVSLASTHPNNPVRQIMDGLNSLESLIEPGDREMFKEYCKHHDLSTPDGIRRCVHWALWLFAGAGLDYEPGATTREQERKQA